MLSKSKDYADFTKNVLSLGFGDLEPTLSAINEIFTECGQDYDKVAAEHAKEMRAHIATLGKRAPFIALAFRPLYGSYRNVPVTKVAKPKKADMVKVAKKVEVKKPAKNIGDISVGDVLVTNTHGDKWSNYRFWKVTSIGTKNIQTVGLSYDIQKLSETETRVQPNELENGQHMTGKFNGKNWTLSAEGIKDFTVVGKFDANEKYVNVWSK